MFKFIFSILLINLSVCKISTTYLYQTKYVEVPLDHFGYATNHTFSLRYLINSSYVENLQSPILFYTGNEGDIELFAQNTGFIWENAPHLNAMIVFAEHRYYGKSLPFGNNTFDLKPEHLGYLTSEQALADYAQLLDHINSDGNRRPVIAIGGSYGGMLAAWFRFKYPHIITGALAASAPVLQFPGITPCNVFSKIITSVFGGSSSYSTKNIRRSWEVLKNYSSTDTGRAELNAQFKFCTLLTKPDDIEHFFDYLEDVYGNLAMANYPYENDFLAPLPAYPVREFCKELAKNFNGLDLIKALQKAVNIYANYTGEHKCLDYKSAYDNSMGTLGWDYQSCTEMVMPMCSNGKTDMFREKKWDLKKYSDDCFTKFGVRPRPNHIINTFSVRNIDSASNIIYSNGLLDPWSGGGVFKISNPELHVLVIAEGAHHLDLRAANEFDPLAVREIRKYEVNIIRNWISDYYNSL